LCYGLYCTIQNITLYYWFTIWNATNPKCYLIEFVIQKIFKFHSPKLSKKYGILTTNETQPPTNTTTYHLSLVPPTITIATNHQNKNDQEVKQKKITISFIKLQLINIKTYIHLQKGIFEIYKSMGCMKAMEVLEEITYNLNWQMNYWVLLPAPPFLLQPPP